MDCRMCGYKFDEEEIGKNCHQCGKSNCRTVHCPNCGYGNSPEFEKEFELIKTLKKKLSLINNLIKNR
ncbi:MAG: hypothetical protein LBB45_07365 [Methanobrevibacter sp.]|nr:hypothetical protein [Candidatus Methanovirga basalitermitum]